MKKLPGQNIYYSNFQTNNLNKISKTTAKTKIRSVIMGICKSGKTTFINRLCNTNHPTGIKIGSTTREIAYEDVVFFQKNIFRIYDTPGTNSRQNALEHAKILRASLTCIPLNLILISVKYQDACDLMFEKFSQLLRIFKGYETMVVMLISFLDRVQPQQNETVMENFNDQLKKYKVNCPIVFYSNKKKQQSDPQCLSKLLYLIGQQKSPQLIKINDEHFYKYFNIAKTSKSISKITVYIDQITDQCKKFIETFQQLDKNTPDIDNLVSQLKMFMKFSLKDKRDDQYKEYSAEFDDHITTDLYLMISQIICSKMEEADFIADKFYTKIIQGEFKEMKADIRDMIKQCPKCLVIWMRVQGCQSSSCGNRPYNYFEYIKNPAIQKYIFSLDSKKGIYTFNKQKRKDLDKTEWQSKKQKFNESKLYKSQGCGSQMQWNNLPRLSNIDQLLKQIYGTSNYEEIKLSQDFLKEKKKEHIKAIDGQFYKALYVMKKSE